MYVGVCAVHWLSSWVQDTTCLLLDLQANLGGFSVIYFLILNK